MDDELTWPPGGKSTSFAIQLNKMEGGEYEQPGFGFGLHWSDIEHQKGPYISVDIWRWSFQAGWLRW